MKADLIEDYGVILALSLLGVSIYSQLYFLEKYKRPYSEKLELEIARSQLEAYGTTYNLL